MTRTTPPTPAQAAATARVLMDATKEKASDQPPADEVLVLGPAVRVDPVESRLADLEATVERLVVQLEKQGRPADPFPCPRCRCTRTPVRNGSHASAAGPKKYRECAACGWTFSTITPHEGPNKGVQILA